MEEISPKENKYLKYLAHETIKIKFDKKIFCQLIKKINDSFPNYRTATYKCKKPMFRYNFPNDFSKSDLENANMFVLKDNKNILIEGFSYGNKGNFVIHIFVNFFSFYEFKLLAKLLDEFNIKLPTLLFYEKEHKKELAVILFFLPVILFVVGSFITLKLYSYVMFVLLSSLIILFLFLALIIRLLIIYYKTYHKKNKKWYDNS